MLGCKFRGSNCPWEAIVWETTVMDPLRIHESVSDRIKLDGNHDGIMNIWPLDHES